ncbi:putative disease resistance protein Aig2 [Aspergillus uvarum CBS 121591]|uniref:Putative gamma-glutamylcyclotransferase n=1 Tax=Aspergillus uvarum CBS 121591 TaxID=1448315 RepID=A0A319CII2_9EURO|nr:putative disease resistance protein Aig2 [Aspergillus uvarum CBS 121591]PYH78493.1 putative disease resistance protein Aig2 [Aspergillus uvarum CBS 121591]
MGDHTLFFYGTLMAPQILHRVIHGRPDPDPWQKAYLTIQPAILHHYRRHRVRHADYPGIVAVPTPVPGSSPGEASGEDAVSKEDLAADSLPRHAVQAEAAEASSASVLGTLVTGLTEGDVYRLDLFEGDEYTKVKVRVQVMREGEGGDEEGVRVGLETAAASAPDGTETEEEVEALTYVWTAGRERLEEAEWDFEAFKRDKMAWWVEADERDW